jgi:hypothetical protein
MRPKAAATSMTGADNQASTTLPINVLGTAPGNILWSYWMGVNFRKKDELETEVATHVLNGI